MTPLLADAIPNITLPLTHPVVIVMAFIVFIAVTVPTINGIMSIVWRFKKTPPDSEVFATKVELKAMRTEVSGKVDELKREMTSNVKDLKDEVTKKVDEIKESVDQSILTNHDNRKEMEQRLHSDMSETKSLSHGMQKELMSIQSQLGRLFGTLEGMAATAKRRGAP